MAVSSVVGVLGTIAYLALKDKLIRDLGNVFAKKSYVERVAAESKTDIDNVGGKITGLVTLVTMMREHVDRNSNNIIRLQEADINRVQPLLRAVERLDNRMNQHENALTKATTVLESLVDRLDKMDDK